MYLLHESHLEFDWTTSWARFVFSENYFTFLHVYCFIAVYEYDSVVG